MTWHSIKDRSLPFIKGEENSELLDRFKDTEPTVKRDGKGKKIETSWNAYFKIEWSLL